MKKETPTNLGPEISRGTGANLEPIITNSIAIINSHPCESCQHLRDLLGNPRRKWFRDNGWSDSRVAEAIGVNKSTISRWFSTGSVPRPYASWTLIIHPPHMQERAGQR